MNNHLVEKLNQLQFLFSKPERASVHIGAHKTATTHLQNTLGLCQHQLASLNVNYITRNELRDDLKIISQEKLFDNSNPRFFEKRYTISSKLFRFHGRSKTLAISEENILGNILDVLSVNPYQHPRLNFIAYLQTLTRVDIFMSLRSFSDVYPGGYITALRFNPTQALQCKSQLVLRLQNGLLPSWVEIVKRVEKRLPGCQLKCWTFEEYLHKKDYVISQFLRQSAPPLPQLPKTLQTATPTVDAVAEVEAMITHKGFKKGPDWLQQCGAIFRKAQVSDTNPKYTFLTPKLQRNLNEKFEEDIKILKQQGYMLND